jgi:hypothetical protein
VVPATVTPKTAYKGSPAGEVLRFLGFCYVKRASA